MSILKKLLQLKKKKISYYTTPSHAQTLPFKSVLGKNYYAIDLSEVDGLDNLNFPETCIVDFEEKLKEIYDSGFSHILTNGSTQGILGLMLATIKDGDKVICTANCHKSVHNGLVLTGANPIWVEPNFDNEFGFYTSVNYQKLEATILENTDAKCLILTNPTYDGAMSDVAKISRLCKEHDITFIVDEAHGALWNFDRTIGTPAILVGADAAVQSLHKTCGAVNPTAVVHLSLKSKITKAQLMDALNLISTTSPSFALMCNIEETVNYLKSNKGQKNIELLINTIVKTISKLKKLEYIRVFDKYNDLTRIAIKFTNITAQEASEILYKKFKIECEIQHKQTLTFVCGIGTTIKKIEKLYDAIKYLNKLSKRRMPIEQDEFSAIEKEIVKKPKEAFYAKYEEVLPTNAVGKISADLITTYPPGIPVLTYGERISEEHIKILNQDNKIRIVK